MSINIKRFDPENATPGHEGTILGSNVLPDSISAPFLHQYGYLAERGRTMAGHSHPTDEIYIVLSGTGHVVVGGENCAVRAGDTVAIPAGQWHTMMCADCDEAPLLWAALWWQPVTP
jgi:mannose-6-phosphate isomerase-like protein (cupin superfamily)